MNAELGEDILHVMPHRVRAQVEPIGDLPVRRSPREQTRDVRLTPGQPQPSEGELRPDFTIVREAHGDSHLERGEQESEQCFRRVSWAGPTRTNRRLDVAVRDAQCGVSVGDGPVDVLAVVDPAGRENLAEESRSS